MKISEVTVDLIKQYAVIEINDDDALIQDVFMPAAKAYILDYTGLTAEDADLRDSLTAAYIALCAFLYDNRSMSIVNDKQNTVIRSFLDSHCVNFV